MPTPKPHKWVYAELAPVPPTEGARPAQRCARCGLVRRWTTAGAGMYLDGDKWTLYLGEPPCVPQEAPATPTERP